MRIPNVEALKTQGWKTKKREELMVKKKEIINKLLAEYTKTHDQQVTNIERARDEAERVYEEALCKLNEEYNKQYKWACEIADRQLKGLK